MLPTSVPSRTPWVAGRLSQDPQPSHRSRKNISPPSLGKQSHNTVTSIHYDILPQPFRTAEAAVERAARGISRDTTSGPDRTPSRWFHLLVKSPVSLHAGVTGRSVLAIRFPWSA
eukprot:GFKZ01010124.1.p1 GENE.GFKZ01010124.1~~GFKZ01010124.1.p1  ORF type:complete len:115 (-),score=6.20 GFKZ01010124.1:1172-1516(-)